MTDLTDQDRRDAREWAEKIDPTYRGNSRPLLNAARVILATVDAPAPTLAEDILDAAARIRDAVNPGDRDVSWADMESCATRVDQMEHDLAEARAEVERLVGNLHTAEHNHAFAAEKWTQMEKERDEARAEVTEWKRRTDRARAEVERLTAERLDRNPETKARVEVALNNLNKAETVTVQKAAESNAETPNPADVKPGEVWRAHIWYDGVRQPGTAIKSAGSSDWVVIRDDGSRTTFRMNEYVELVSRLVPTPRVITNPDELDALPDDTIVRIDEGGDAMRKYKGKWHPTSNECCYESRHIALPVTVLWEPGV